jgi:hypothetical protein
MKLLKQAWGGLGALTVFGVVVAFVAPKTAHALAAALVQIVPGTTTHVGQSESQLVSLICLQHHLYCSAIDAEGNISTSAYVVPAGYTLIITDYQSNMSDPDNPNQEFSDFLLNQNANPTNKTLIFTQGLSDKYGTAYGHEHLVSGVRLASGGTPMDADAIGQTLAFAQGYLVPN